MLVRLAIQNIAIIDSLTLAFAPGMNVITGETGSGKSLILDSIQRLFEKRSSPKELLRHGENRGRIELRFDLSQLPNRNAVETLLTETGVDLLADEQELVLSRDLTPTSSRCRINGTPVTVEIMEKLGGLMLEIYGQHDLHTLFSASRQRDLLDGMGGPALTELRQEIRRTYRELQRLRADSESLSRQQADQQRQVDFLTYQIQEIAQAELGDPMEDVFLQHERERLGHSEQLRHAAFQAAQLISGEDQYDAPSVLKLLGQVQKTLSQSTAVDQQLCSAYEQVSDMQESLRHLTQWLYTYGEQLDSRPERMQEIIDRLDVLEKLKRKYGGSVEAMLQTATELEAELDTLQRADTHLAELDRQIAEFEHRYAALCCALTDLRKRVASTLQADVQNELADLMLPAATFAIEVQPTPPGETGQDSVAFLFSANPGEPLKPLAQVASGGELGRLMLALKMRTAHADSLATLILDEIDTGMSGVTVRAVAEKLQRLENQCQVILITHQPILAAKAQWHLHVQKQLLPQGVQVTATALTQHEARRAVLSQLASGLTQDDDVTGRFIEQLLG